jgi:co-chaperonin GroES (HSP10)
MVPEVDTKFEGSELVRPDAVVDQERFATVVLFVMKLGKDCYTDKVKYPSGPLCKEGDFVICRQYSGTRLRIHGKEFRILYEDQVEATVQDPRGITRI